MYKVLLLIFIGLGELALNASMKCPIRSLCTVTTQDRYRNKGTKFQRHDVEGVEKKDTALRPTISIYNYGYRFVPTRTGHI